jgi:hypothetical protein
MKEFGPEKLSKRCPISVQMDNQVKIYDPGKIPEKSMHHPSTFSSESTFLSLWF